VYDRRGRRASGCAAPDEAAVRLRAHQFVAPALLALLALQSSETGPAGVRARDLELEHNFGSVVDGVLLRSRAPSRAFLEYLRERYGVRTVVDLRDPANPHEGPLVEHERRWAADLGLTHISYPLRAPLDADRAVDFVEALVSSAAAPVLVHCEGGKDRTGVLVALVRLREGRDYRFALDEMERYHHNPARHGGIQAFLRARFAERQPP
jgi:protein tyrosine/serine phosphatase